MPSAIIDATSGGVNIVSGNYFSGQGSFKPVGGVKLKAWDSNSGTIYIALSGGVTVLSGMFQASGGLASGGKMDGYPLGRGDTYEVPRLGYSSSGTFSGTCGLFVTPDAACSGQARVFWEAY